MKRKEENASRVMAMMIERITDLSPNFPNRTWNDPEYNSMHDTVFSMHLSTESLVKCVKCAETELFGEPVDEDEDEIIRFVLAFRFSVKDIRCALEI